MAEKKQSKGLLERMSGNIRSGDKVIWLIFVILLLVSLVAIFSSTSMKTVGDESSRTDLIGQQFIFVSVCLVSVILLSAISNIKFFRGLSKMGFIGSLILLLFLDLHLSVGPIKAIKINNAYRSILVGSFTFQVFEAVKVMMVMYLAWAIQTYENGKFTLVKILNDRWPGVFGWMKDPKAQKWIFIFIPIIAVTLLILPGSTGSAILTTVVMFVTLLIGGIKWKDFIIPVALGLGAVTLVVTIHIASSGKIVHRLQTVFNRFLIELPYPDPEIRAKQKKEIEKASRDPETLEPGTIEFQEYLDKKRQPMAARIAIVEGGRRPMGKHPGKSTQKFVVPLMFEDYMFSLLIEEYGLIFGLILILMYLSLFARGVIIAQNCNNRYAKACVGGLAFLITFQALFHIFINCDIGPSTGQTLPLISYGRSSLLCFSLALGVILSISKMANNKIKQQQEAEARLMATDEIQVSMDVLDDIDNQFESLENQEITNEDESNN